MTLSTPTLMEQVLAQYPHLPHALGIIFTLSTFVTLTRRNPYYAKTALALCLVGFVSAVGILIAFVAWPLGQRTSVNYYYARFSYFFLTWPLGVKLIIEDADYLEGRVGIVVCNHQTSMDVIPLTLIVPRNCVMMAKKVIRLYPFLGPYMMLSHTIFLDRARHQKAVHSLIKAAETVKKEQISVLIFPEGTRSHLREGMLPFKTGAFHLAQQAQVPILPVVISSYSDVYCSATRSFPGGTIRIRALPPIETKGLKPEDVRELTETVRTAMLDVLTEISPPPPVHDPSKGKTE